MGPVVDAAEVQKPLAIAGALSFLAVAWVTWELLFSPLRAFRGPFIAKFTDIWRAAWTAKGDIDATHRQWHRKYDAAAVRIGPNTVSIGDPDLIRVIYSTKDAWVKVSIYFDVCVGITLTAGTVEFVRT